MLHVDDHRARKIELAHIETKARTRLAWDEVSPHHIAEGTLAVSIRSSAREFDVRKPAQDARDHCPICNVLAATTKIGLTVFVLPTEH